MIKINLALQQSDQELENCAKENLTPKEYEALIMRCGEDTEQFRLLAKLIIEGRANGKFSLNLTAP